MKKIILIILVSYSALININAQYDHRIKIGISAGISQTGSLKYGDKYRLFDSSPTIEIRKIGSSRNSNYNFGLSYQISDKFSITGSIGTASYGFIYTGDVIASPINMASVGGFSVTESFYTRLMEVGLSASYHYNLSNDLSIIIQPGLAWYTNQRFDRFQILEVGQNSNNFSATLFAGVEVPIVSNIFYASIGIQSKLALSNFAHDFSYKNEFFPYGIGIHTSISYRFWKR